MKTLYVAMGIYGIGVTYVACGALYGLSALIAEKGFSINLITKLPLFIVTATWMMITWPWMLVKEPSFRQDIIDTGRIIIIIGYAVSAIFTISYPWIWAWYISGVVAWILLERYHERVSLEIKTS